MLIIRGEQKRALLAVRRQSFARDVIRHLEAHFPAVCRAIGRDGVASAVEHGMARAEAYGITAPNEICKYLNLMFVFGRHFDEDLDLPWAREVLTKDEPARQSTRMQRLYAKALKRSSEGRGFDKAPRKDGG